MEAGRYKLTKSWIPGDDAPEGNWERWALSRYCFDREGVVIPAMVDAMERWPLERFEQVAGIAAERGDMAAAWQDFRHKRAATEAQRDALAHGAAPR